jgi:hypothetical protein
VKGVIDEAKIMDKVSVAEVRDNMASTVSVSHTSKTRKEEETHLQLCL